MSPRILLLLFSFAHAAFVSLSVQAEAPVVYRLVLEDALRRPERNEEVHPSMILHLRRDENGWDRVTASAGGFNQHDQLGYVAASETSEAGLRLDLVINIRGDAWVPGGRWESTLNLTHGENGEVSGTHASRFRGLEFSHPLQGRRYTAFDRRREPLAGNARPRLLFRAEDLPAVRAKAETPIGQAALANLPESAAASAFRYALTEDVAHAEDARRRLALLMEDAGHGPNAVLSRYWAWRLEQAAIALDLCYAAWEEPFRQSVENYLHNQSQVLMHNRQVFSNRIRWGHGGPHAPTLFYAAGLAGLALEGIPGQAPTEPSIPYLLGELEGVIPADPSFVAGEGVTVFEFETEVMPTGWLYAGAFPEAEQPLGSHEARAAVRPAEGDTIGQGDQAGVWRRIEEEKEFEVSNHTGNRPMLLITGPSGVVTRSNSYWFMAMRNDKPRWVRLHTRHGGVDNYVNGVRLRENDVVFLEEGMYAWLTTGPIGQVNPWARAFMEPKWIELSDEEVIAAKTAARNRYENEMADWRAEQQFRERGGGENLAYQRTAAMSRHIMEMVFSEMLGRGGFLAGADRIIGMDGPHKYAFAHLNARGTVPGLDAESADFLIRSLFVHPHRDDRKVPAQEISGFPGFKSAQYPDGGRDLAVDLFAGLFPLVREEWRPAVMWAWEYHTGGNRENPEGLNAFVRPPGRPYPFEQAYGAFNTQPIYAFLTLPSAETLEAKHPEGVLPLTFAAPDYGFYGFRNQWTGDDGLFITQFFSASDGGGAGSLRVSGLGQTWSHSSENAPPERRFFENVVQVPDLDLNGAARGKALHHETRADGSGSLVVSLDDVYTKTVFDARGRARDLYDTYGNVPRANAFGESGITGFRSMAVDYSGKSGAPAVIVLADRIKGVERALWAWQLDGESRGLMQENLDTGEAGREIFAMDHYRTVPDRAHMLTEREAVDAYEGVELHADGFTIRRGDASMRVTFLRPSAPKLSLENRVQYHKSNIEVVNRSVSTGIFAEGEGDFLAVLTFQRGEAPAVALSETDGSAATFTVGEQSVHFDGEHIRFQP